MIIKKIRVPVIKGNVRNMRGDIVLYSQLAFSLRIVRGKGKLTALNVPRCSNHLERDSLPLPLPASGYP
jgi:hypothetical protein